MNVSSTLLSVPPRLAALNNLKFRKVDFSEIISGSPLEDLWKSGRVWHEGYFGLNNISNLLRLVLLYKCGGTYLVGKST